MIVMKSKITKTRLLICLSLPVLLLSAGCNDKDNSNGTYPAMSNPATNAAMTNADNSGQNVRDRDGTTLTAADQSNSEADRLITQNIRKMVVSGTNNFSVTAKNVKIITASGKVTLRGPVNSADEKMSIETIAKGVAGDGNVDDQLEVKAQP
jgi:osmotically-inducible protein OsmY